MDFKKKKTDPVDQKMRTILLNQKVNLIKLKFHRDKHMGVKKFECGFELCNAQYQKKSHLSRHQDVKHLKIPYNCEVAGCSSRYTRKEFLKAHLINNHKDLECLEILLDNLKNLKVKIDEADYKIIKLD